MAWNLDTETMNAFDDLMMSMAQPLDRFLEQMVQHSEQSPPWLVLFSYGKFVMEYDTQRNLGHEPNVAYNMAMAAVIADPQVQALLARFTQEAMQKGLMGGFGQ